LRIDLSTTPTIPDRRLRFKSQEGQSLIETALTIPLLLGLAFNMINFGYMWFMVLTISAAPRIGAEFATQGGAAGTGVSVPSATSISDLVYENLTHAISGATTSNATVRVCTKAVGVNANGSAQCTVFGPAFTFSLPAVDPEAPTFILHRVDVNYTVTPVIPGKAFNIFVFSNLNFHRQVSMRSLY
jgi:Flp pilus assembly protein TadG